VNYGSNFNGLLEFTYFFEIGSIKKKIIKIMYGNIRKKDIIEDVRLFKYAT
jgi:hypothetical protein